MKPSEIRKKLHQYLDDADNETLQFLNETVVAYKAKKKKENKTNSEPEPRFPSMTEEELYARIEESEERLKKGEYYTEDEMDKFLSKLKHRVV